MKKRMQNVYRQFKPKLHWFIQNEGISLILSLIVLFLAFYLFLKTDYEELNPFDYSVFITVIIAIFLNFFSVFIAKFLANYFEDDLKLTSDYEGLAKKYTHDGLIIDNNEANGVTKENMRVIQKIKKVKIHQNIKVKLPIIVENYLYEKNVQIEDDKDERYHLPSDIKEQFHYLFKAHSSSTIYNQLNVRVSDWKEIDNIFIMRTSRTTFFDSLVTNRAMDYRWPSGITNRDLYGYGPFFPSLMSSNLSNHLGYNMMVETSDGNLLFVKRKKNVSIEKGLYSTSVAASLKARSALNKAGEFTLAGLEQAILDELYDELKIESQHVPDFSLKNNLIYAYRDMVEGGKPQFVLYVKCTLNREEIIDGFKRTKKAENKKKHRENKVEFNVLEDGTVLEWIPKDRLNELAFTTDCMIYNGKAYRMVPSKVATIYLCREHLKNLNEI